MDRAIFDFQRYIPFPAKIRSRRHLIDMGFSDIDIRILSHAINERETLPRDQWYMYPRQQIIRRYKDRAILISKWHHVPGNPDYCWKIRGNIYLKHEQAINSIFFGLCGRRYLFDRKKEYTVNWMRDGF